ncbi:MAG TPA: heme biosynthesis HemY N-terminal domain-containing protein [Stellaceae bacterium]|nr:heme biosynthesis HemY N-terminal domain-containing protein [Stellaceae bacterium]
MRALPALIAIALVVAAAVLIASQPGRVAVTWQGWEIETSVAVMGLAVAFAALVIAFVFTLLRWIVRGPGAWARARRERRRRDGYRALTQGMVAVAAGDAEEAQKLARKADSLLAEPPLTLLLSAQAAQLSGDEGAATRYFNAMLERPETEFLGLRGLLMQALRGGDQAGALRLAERAKALRPKTPWVLSNLLELQARARRWQAAEATLVEVTRRKALPPPDARHRHAVVLHEHASEADAEGRAGEAMRLQSRAHALEPAFAPVAVRYARMLALRGQRRKARRALEAAWRAAPHPTLAEAYGALFAGEPILQRMKHLERLASFHPGHAEGHIALANAALEARLWGEARRHLAAAQGDGAGNATPRVCRLMADVEESENGDHAAARSWLARAGVAALPDPAWVCDACGVESVQWAAQCPGCDGFATLAWRGSDRPPPARRTLDAAASARPLLPTQS